MRNGDNLSHQNEKAHPVAAIIPRKSICPQVKEQRRTKLKDYYHLLLRKRGPTFMKSKTKWFNATQHYSQLQENEPNQHIKVLISSQVTGN